jgi:hypothetical protein
MEFGISIDFGLVAKAFFYMLLFFFSIYGIFLAYHWFSFGTSKNTSTIALAVYLLGGAILFLTLATSMQLF